MDGHTDGSHVALRGLHVRSYMEIPCAPRTKTLPHDFRLPSMEGIPKILVPLTPPPPYKEKPCIPRIWASSTSLYKPQVSFFPRYAENL